MDFDSSFDPSSIFQMFFGGGGGMGGMGGMGGNFLKKAAQEVLDLISEEVEVMTFQAFSKVGEVDNIILDFDI